MLTHARCTCTHSARSALVAAVTGRGGGRAPCAQGECGARSGAQGVVAAITTAVGRTGAGRGARGAGLFIREWEAAAHLAVRRAEAAEEKRHAASSHGVDQRAASALGVALQRAVGR